MTTEKTPEPAAETPPKEATVEDLRAQIETLKGENAGESRKVSELTKELQKSEAGRQEWKTELDSVRSEVQMIASLAAQGRQPQELDDTTPTEKVDLAEQFKKMRKEDDIKRIGRQYETKVAELGLTADDTEYHDVLRDVQMGNYTGDYKAADARIRKLEKAKVPTEEPKPDEDKYKKDVDEAARKMLDEQGKLGTDLGGPSASGRKDYIQASKDYADGKITVKEYDEIRVREGI